MQTALITGVGGFCGPHLAHRLRSEASLRLVGVGLGSSSQVPYLDEYISADIGDRDAAARVVAYSKPDLVFHLAGKARADERQLFRSNLLATSFLLEALHSYAPEAKILLVGSSAEYGDLTPEQLPAREEYLGRPVGAYAISKHLATQVGLDYGRRRNMKIVIARPFNIVGVGIPSTLVVGAVLERARKELLQNGELVIKVGNLEAERDFVAVEDVIEAYCQMLRGDCWGEIFNICSGQPHSIQYVVKLLLSFSEREIRLDVDPTLCRQIECKVSYGSYEKAHRAFGFEPKTPLAAALRAAWNHVVQDKSQCVSLF